MLWVLGFQDVSLKDYPSAASFVLIYTRSLLVEQTTPVGSFLNDSVASVRNVSFTDLDLDNLELGGNVPGLNVILFEPARGWCIHNAFSIIQHIFPIASLSQAAVVHASCPPGFIIAMLWPLWPSSRNIDPFSIFASPLSVLYRKRSTS